MKSARLSSQTILTSNQRCRPPTLSLYAKSAADLRQTGGGTRGRERPTLSRKRKLEASVVMNAKVPGPARHPANRRAGPRSELPPAARRALEEAAARRAKPKPVPHANSMAAAARSRALRRLGGEGSGDRFLERVADVTATVMFAGANSLKGSDMIARGRPAPLAFDGLCGLAAASIPAMNLRMRGAISLRNREPLKTP